MKHDIKNCDKCQLIVKDLCFGILRILLLRGVMKKENFMATPHNPDLCPACKRGVESLGNDKDYGFIKMRDR